MLFYFCTCFDLSIVEKILRIPWLFGLVSHSNFSENYI